MKLSLKHLAILLLLAVLPSLLACAGGSLMHPTPLVGRDRLVFRVIDSQAGVTYYTRSLWFDGDNYRFRDVLRREIRLPKTEQVAVEVITPEEYFQSL